MEMTDVKSQNLPGVISQNMHCSVVALLRNGEPDLVKRSKSASVLSLVVKRTVITIRNSLKHV